MVLRILLLALCCACIPKSSQPVVSAELREVTLATVDYSPGDGAPPSLPPIVQDALESELRARGLQPSSPEGLGYRDGSGQFQVVQRQLAQISEAESGSDLIVLLHKPLCEGQRTQAFVRGIRNEECNGRVLTSRTKGEKGTNM